MAAQSTTSALPADLTDTPASQSPLPPTPPTAAPILGESPAATEAPPAPADDPSLYPTGAILLPGHHADTPMNIAIYNDRLWLLAEEVATLLGMSPEATAEMTAMIDGDLVNEFPVDGVAKVRLGSSSVILRLLNVRAIKKLWLTSDSPIAEGLANWMEDKAQIEWMQRVMGSVDDLGGTAQAVADDRFDQIDKLHTKCVGKWYQIEAQVTAIDRLSLQDNQFDPRKTVQLMGTLAETTLGLLKGMETDLEAIEKVAVDVRGARIRREVAHAT